MPERERCHYVVYEDRHDEEPPVVKCDRRAGHKKSHRDNLLGIWWDYDA